MRHQARFGGDRLDQDGVGLDAVDRRNPQTRHRGQPQDAAHQVAQARPARQVGAPAGQVDAGQHHLVEPPVHQPRDLVHHHAGGDRPRIAPAIGNDAERAAVVAAVLDLNIGAMPAEPVDQVPRGFAHRQDVVDLHPLGHADQVGHGQRGPGRGLHLLVVADDARHLGHGDKGLGFGLRGAAGDDDRGPGIFARQAADVLLCLAHRLAGHGAGVHHHCARQARGGSKRLHRLGLIGVQAAAQGGKDRGVHRTAAR